jgi:hypothetical protein
MNGFTPILPDAGILVKYGLSSHADTLYAITWHLGVGSGVFRAGIRWRGNECQCRDYCGSAHRFDRYFNRCVYHQAAWGSATPTRMVAIFTGKPTPARATGSYVMPALKTSRSLWWGLAGLVLWLLPILGYIVTLPGLFTAIRDIRSPGTRRYAMIGLVLCLLAFTLTIINSAIGAYEGAHGTGWWQHG